MTVFPLSAYAALALYFVGFITVITATRWWAGRSINDTLQLIRGSLGLAFVVALLTKIGGGSESVQALMAAFTASVLAVVWDELA